MKDACKKIVALGYQPVPHVGARHFADEAQLREHLTAARDGGARRLLVIAGDRDDSQGPYIDAMSVLSHAMVSDLGFAHVSVSGHPEGHSRINGDQLLDALEDKLEMLAVRGIQASITTQFGFDAATYVRWINMLRERDIDTPINIGVAGVTSIPSLIKYAALCGVGPSLSALRKRSGAMVGLLKGYEPTELVNELSQTLTLNDKAPVKLHFFPFGGARKTFDWITARSGTPK
nr:methylenetetrahydrofolate reductase [Yoonia ponticola]